MLQQPSEFIMHRKLPLDLNRHTLDLNSYQQDFNDIGLLQAQRAAAHALFFNESCSTREPTPSPNWAIHAMYDPIPNHQQQHRQYFAPMAAAAAAAAGLWQQQASNCWFPNWQELFQGFSVAQEGQQKKAIAAGFQQQQGGVAGAHQLRPDAPLPHSGAQSLNPGSHLAAQLRHPGAQLPYSAAKLSPPAFQSSLIIEKKKSEDAQISCSDLKGPSAPTLGSIAKYTIESPPWLPQGWITELQTRRTGTTAGTRDKYFKDLVSGRRFRSRNEVFHFLETGKGRVRKRLKRKKAIASSADHPAIHSFAHRIHTLEATKPSPCLPPCQPVGLLLGSFVNKHPTHVEFSLPPLPVAEEMPRGLEAPCKPPTAFSASSSSQPPIMLGLKRPAQERLQKLPAKKKAKTESLKKCEDKQASRLWQWLQKPVARNDKQQPEKPEVHHPNANAASFEKRASEMADQMTMEELSRGKQAAQRRVQLGREIQEAQRTVMQLGREMQATVEKLSKEIQAAQRDVELGNNDKLCRAVRPAQWDAALASETKAAQGRVKSSMELQAVHRTIDSMGYVIQTAERINGAVGNVMQATQRPVVAMGNVIQASQRPDAAIMGTAAIMGPVPQAAEWPVVAMDNAIQAAPRPHVAICHVTQAAKKLDVTMGNVTQAAQRLDFAMGSSIQAAQRPAVAGTSNVTQAALRPDVAMGNRTPAAQMPVVAKGSVIQEAHRPDVAMGNLTPPAQMPVVAKGNVIQEAHRHVVAMGHVTQEAPQGPFVALGHVIQQSQMPVAIAMGNGVLQRAGGAMVNATHAARLNVMRLGTEMQAGRRPVGVKKKKMVEGRPRHRDKKFSVLNPKLDLSRLNPNLSSRQRAKVVQRMKAKHAKDLLAILGRQLCRKALRGEGRYKHGLNL